MKNLTFYEEAVLPQPLEDPAALLQDRESLLVAYRQLCQSYNAIRAFRARLLGLLPLVSAGGIFLFLNSNTISSPGSITLIVVGILGCLITFGLYLYERHNMDRCHDLIRIGADWEENSFRLKKGQFMMRVTHHQDMIVAESRYKWAARLIYGAVFWGWLYVSLAGLLLVVR